MKLLRNKTLLLLLITPLYNQAYASDDVYYCSNNVYRHISKIKDIEQIHVFSFGFPPYPQMINSSSNTYKMKIIKKLKSLNINYLNISYDKAYDYPGLTFTMDIDPTVTLVSSTSGDLGKVFRIDAKIEIKDDVVGKVLGTSGSISVYETSKSDFTYLRDLRKDARYDKVISIADDMVDKMLMEFEKQYRRSLKCKQLFKNISKEK